LSEPTHQYDDTGLLWWPYRQYVLDGKLSRQQIKEKLESTGKEGGSTYTARYTEKGIYVKEAINFKFGAYSRAFKPEATIVEIGPSKFRVTIKLPAAQLLLLLTALLLIVAGIAFSKRGDLAASNFKNTLIVCCGVMFLGYLLPVVTFNAELNKLKLFIDDLLEVQS